MTETIPCKKYLSTMEECGFPVTPYAAYPILPPMSKAEFEQTQKDMIKRITEMTDQMFLRAHEQNQAMDPWSTKCD